MPRKNIHLTQAHVDAFKDYLLENVTIITSKEGNEYVGLPATQMVTAAGLTGRISCAWFGLKDAAEAGANRVVAAKRMVANMTAEEKQALLEELGQ